MPLIIIFKRIVFLWHRYWTPHTLTNPIHKIFACNLFKSPLRNIYKILGTKYNTNCLATTCRIKANMRNTKLQFEKDIKNEMRSLGPVLCSSVRWPAKSSVTKLGSPPGMEAHTGHTTWNRLNCGIFFSNVRGALLTTSILHNTNHHAMVLVEANLRSNWERPRFPC